MMNASLSVMYSVNIRTETTCATDFTAHTPVGSAAEREFQSRGI